MATKTMRVSEQVHEEIQDLSAMLGYTPAELLQRAWATYRRSPEFHDDFSLAQQAFQKGDPDTVLERLQERRRKRAAEAATKARGGSEGE
jgi:predicted DNA-binding protein